MVMDATQPQQPSPQIVGREFVRQYYTLLNKAPNHLHRFYTNYSSFIHGESNLVVGQKNIHNRIQQLNFHDCHAKISQVDAQATLGNGVVVQVTGELSNDGQPMRRFTQTFVLASQSPKNYYVHNDIFRYQDMYSDEENEGEVRSENGEELEQPTSITGNGGGDQQTQSVNAALIETPSQLAAQLVAAGAVMQAPPPQQTHQPTNAPQQHAIFYPMPAAGGRPVPVLAAAPQGTAVPLPAQFPATPSAATATIPPQSVAGSNVSHLNGVVAHDDLLSGMQQQPTHAGAASSAQSVLVGGGTPAAATAAVQSATTAVPVANVLNAPAAAASAANAAALPQNSAAGVLSYQQSQLMQQPLVQPSQQQLMATPTQSASASQITSAANLNDYDEGNNNENQSSSENAAIIAEPTVIMPLVAPIVDDFKTINEQQLQEKYEAAKQQQNEPKTYANLFKTTSTSPSSFVTAAMQQQQQVQQQQQQQQHQQQQQTTNNSYQSTTSIPSATFTQSSNAASMQPNFNRNANSSIDTNSNPLNQGGPLPQRNSAARGNKDYEQRRTSNAQQFGDNQQLFVGNIPHHASEDELKSLFARFGSIVELRILSKPGGGKMTPGVRSPLNYGFITFEEAESVQTCMAACPLYFPEGAHDAQKLNVEEKRPRMRDLPPRQSMNMSAGGGNSSAGGNSGIQRNMSGGGPQSRSSLSNSGNNSGMMRGSSGGGGANNSGMSRGGPGSGQRMGGGFNRNDNRSGSQSNGGGQMRGGSNNSQTGGGAGGGNNNSYAGRR